MQEMPLYFTQMIHLINEGFQNTKANIMAKLFCVAKYPKKEMTHVSQMLHEFSVWQSMQLHHMY